MRFDSQLGWANKLDIRIKKNGKAFTINSQGYRGPEVQRLKKHIILMGDSVVWGSGVDDKETAAYFLGKNLNHNSLYLENDIAHFSPKGHEVFSGIIYEFLKGHKMISS